jgi:6-phosphogluconolactonase (cycloisomerase 2 family)
LIWPYKGTALVHPSGKFLYDNDRIAEKILGYAIDANGHLTALAGSPFPVSFGASNPYWLATDPAGNFLYSATIGQSPLIGNISIMSVDQSRGALASLPDSPVSTGFAPNALVVGP